MGDKTGIEWTDATWNPVAGCSLVSPGCTNCYAMKQAARLLDKPGSHYEGTTKTVHGNAVWTGKVAQAPDHILFQPLRWQKPKRIFVNSMSDLFHDSVPDILIDTVFAIMAATPQHAYQVLTKRPARMKDYLTMVQDEAHRWTVKRFADVWPKEASTTTFDIPLKNVWLGVSVEDQQRANERVPLLLDTPAAIRFLSMEPLLSHVSLESADRGENALYRECWGECANCNKGHAPCHGCPRVEEEKWVSGIDWVIVGGESGPGARPMNPFWVQSLREQCKEFDVPFFFKQWGEWAPGRNLTIEEREKLADKLSLDDVHIWPDSEDDPLGMMARVGKKAAGRILDGVVHDGFPKVAA